MESHLPQKCQISVVDFETFIKDRISRTNRISAVSEMPLKVPAKAAARATMCGGGIFTFEGYTVAEAAGYSEARCRCRESRQPNESEKEAKNDAWPKHSGPDERGGT